MDSLRSVALLCTVVFVVKLPYVLLALLLAFIYGCICRILSIPVRCLARTSERVKLLWSWSKGRVSRARLSLPWCGRNSAVKGTQTLELPGPPPLYDDEDDDPEDSGVVPVQAVRRGHRSRRVLLQALRPLLLPPSPSESDEETERKHSYGREEEEEEAEGGLRLIFELIRLSRMGLSSSESSSPKPPQEGQQVPDLAALCRHARDQEMLQKLIAELDRLASSSDVDPATLLKKKRPESKKPPAYRQPPSPEAHTAGEELSASSCESPQLSPVTSEATFSEDSEIRSPVSVERQSELEEASQLPRGRYTYLGMLSPVQEDPELRSSSSESVHRLENELNLMLSQLNLETKTLQVDQEAVESMELVTSQPIAQPVQSHSSSEWRPECEHTGRVSTSSDSPCTVPERGTVIWKSNIIVFRKPRDSGISTEDPQEDFFTVPKTPPSLGIVEGHTRCELMARSSAKRRPPTRKATLIEQESLSEPAHSKDTPNLEAELTGTSRKQEEEEEGEDPVIEPRRLPGAVPPLADQIKLLQPGLSSFHSVRDSQSPVSETTVVSQTEPETEREACVTRTRHSSMKETSTVASNVVFPRRNSLDSMSSISGVAHVRCNSLERQPLAIPSTEPPWIEMVEELNRQMEEIQRQMELDQELDQQHQSDLIDQTPPTPTTYYSHSLPMILNYSSRSEFALPVPFVDPVEVLACSSSGGEFTNKAHDITIRIPEGAIPEGLTLAIEVGVTLHGPFSFPASTRPISPILWLCLQQDIALQKPVEVILPHFLNTQEDNEQFERFFLKADHNDCDTGKYNFHQLPHQSAAFYQGEGSSSGHLYTRHFCFLCIAAKKNREVALNAGYCLSRISPIPWPTTSLPFFINFCVTYCLKTCFRALGHQFPSGFKVSRTPFYFENRTDGSQPRLEISLERPDGWIMTLESMKPQITAADVDCWAVDSEKLQLFEEEKMYPPRFEIRICGTGNRGTGPWSSFGKVILSGATQELCIDIPPPLPDASQVLSPRSSSDEGWCQRNLHCRLGEKPRLAQLRLMRTASGEKVEIIKTVATRWRDVGILLDFDPEGEKVEEIEADHKGSGVRACCQEMFKHWLSGGGRPATWATLIEVLEDEEYMHLVALVKSPSVNEISISQRNQTSRQTGTGTPDPVG